VLPPAGVCPTVFNGTGISVLKAPVAGPANFTVSLGDLGRTYFTSPVLLAKKQRDCDSGMLIAVTVTGACPSPPPPSACPSHTGPHPTPASCVYGKWRQPHPVAAKCVPLPHCRPTHPHTQVVSSASSRWPPGRCLMCCSPTPPRRHQGWRASPPIRMVSFRAVQASFARAEVPLHRFPLGAAS
jgi:hypothetical protein